MFSCKLCMIVVTISLFLSFTASVDHGPVDCSMGSRSCESCRAAYPFCYWCDGQCRRYYGKRIAEIECPNGVMYESCQTPSYDRTRLDEMLKLLSSLKNRQSSSSLNEQETGYDERTQQTGILKTSSAKKARLLRILKLLKMLAALEKQAKIKEKTSRKTDLGNFRNSLGTENTGTIDNEVNHGEIANRPEKIKQNAKSSTDLEALLNFVHGKSSTKTPKVEENTLEQLNHLFHAGENVRSTPIPKMQKMSIGNTVKPTWNTTHSVPINRHKNTQILTDMVNKSLSTQTPTTTSRYCELFEEEDECNNDQECSWCNLLSQCIGRNKKDFKLCSPSKKQSEVDDFAGNNICNPLTSCKSCTSNGKCFWCEKTKSCHTYPFFGFIPHNCPANMWYYKECDVQLAIFIILFPLLMILLSMVIFYFCLRYCYYRKRTLKVQLFEKADLFERRKGKKVYFVGGDEEDDESRSEQIRKKYNLPHEKEPLITP